MAKTVTPNGGELRPGQELLHGKFRIEELAGQGSFALVYRARHLSLNVDRALKVLRWSGPGVDSTDVAGFRDRFQLEAQLSARIHQGGAPILACSRSLKPWKTPRA